MVFKKMLRKLGVGGPSVDTVLADPRHRPGDPLTGEVRLVGGDGAAEIEHIALSLVLRVAEAQVGFHRVVVAGGTRLAAGEERAIPFAVPLPWETPLTEVSGHPLPRMDLGLRTEVSIAKALDKGDLDPVIVTPLESQDAVLEAFGELGFLFKSADVEAGRLYGVRQELPFFQEIEFYPPPRYAGRVSEVELSFVASATGLAVVLEVDKRAGRSSAVGQFTAAHDEAVDWTARIGAWLDQAVDSRSVHFGQHDNHGHHGHHGHHGRGGPGMGGMLAGAAAGVVGGMMLGEMLDDDSGDEGDGGDEG
jgi:sporulation-control protein